MTKIAIFVHDGFEKIIEVRSASALPWVTGYRAAIEAAGIDGDAYDLDSWDDRTDMMVFEAPEESTLALEAAGRM